MSYEPKIDLQELLEAGVHFGHQSHRWNPKMRDFIFDARDGVHIFDLVKTAEQLEQAMQMAYELGKNGKNLVFVGTKRQAQELVRAAAEEAGAMYIVTRWMGGFLTNWEQVSKSIAKMNSLKAGLANGKFDHYTKYERMQIQKDIDRLERFFLGVADLKRTPDAIFIVDVSEEEVAAKEAKITNVPIIALVDSNGNPELVDCVIPANDDAVSSIKLLTTMVAQAYAEGKKLQAKN
jgi:small subunit ribosomal protein S2